VDRTLGGGESALTEELHTKSSENEKETLKTKLDQPQVVDTSTGPTRIDQEKQIKEEKQQLSPNRDDSSTLSPKGTISTGDSSGPGTTTVAGPQSGEKEGDTPERLNTPAQPTSATSSSASVPADVNLSQSLPAESSTISTSSTNTSTGNSTSSVDTGVSATADTEGTNTTSTTKAFPENTDRQATKIVNVDSSSVNPLWMRTAAPLLIVVVLFSFT
ncbi:uncharacterized protein TM35_001561020, partial [Trypanosoma theileri]